MNYCNNKNEEDEENIILNDIKSIPPNYFYKSWIILGKQKIIII